MKNLAKLGYNKIYSNLNYTSAEYYIYINHLSSKMDEKIIASSEGLWGAARTTNKHVSNAFYAGGKAISGLWQLIKKLCDAMMKMFENAWLEIGKQHNRMNDIMGKMRNLDQKLSNQEVGNQEAGETPNEEGSGFEFITVKSMVVAGWALFNPGKDKNGKDYSATVFNFYNFLSLQQEYGGPLYAFSKVRNEEQLFECLEELFQLCVKIYQDNPDFTKYVGMEDFIKRLGTFLQAKTVGNARQYQYWALGYDQYGKFIGQALSPAGAYISTNKYDTAKQHNKRREKYEGNLRPPKTANIPYEKVNEEMTKAVRFISILFKFMLDKDFIASLKERGKHFNDFKRIIDRLAKITPKDARRARSMDDAQDSTIEYDPNDNFSDEYRRIETNSGSSESSLLTHELNKINKDLKGFAENPFGGVFSVSSTENMNQHGNAQLNGNMNVFNSSNIEKDNKFGRTSRSVKFTGKTRIKDQDVTPNMIKFGIKYIQAYITQAGNLNFQEGRFYNNMCRVMCEEAEELIETIEDYLNIDDDDNSKGVIEYSQDDNNNTNNNNNQNSNNTNNNNNNNNGGGGNNNG